MTYSSRYTKLRPPRMTQCLLTPTCARSRLIYDYALNEPIEMDDPDLSNERDRLNQTLTNQPYPLHNLPAPIAGRKPLTIPPLSEQPPPLDSYSMSHNKWYIRVTLGIPLSHDIPCIQCHALRPPTHFQPGLLDPDVDMPTTLTAASTEF